MSMRVRNVHARTDHRGSFRVRSNGHRGGLFDRREHPAIAELAELVHTRVLDSRGSDTRNPNTCNPN